MIAMSWAGAELAAARLWGNPRVAAVDILDGHSGATLEQIGREAVNTLAIAQAANS